MKPDVQLDRGTPDGELWTSTASCRSPAEREAMPHYLRANRLPPEQVTSVQCYRQGGVLMLRVEMFAVTDEVVPPWTESPVTRD